MTLAIVLICSLYEEVSQKVPSATISGIPQILENSEISVPFLHSFDGKILQNTLLNQKTDLLVHQIQEIQDIIILHPGLQTGRKAVLLSSLHHYQQGQYLACLVCMVPQIEFLLRMLFIHCNSMSSTLATSGVFTLCVISY